MVFQIIEVQRAKDYSKSIRSKCKTNSAYGNKNSKSLKLNKIKEMNYEYNG